MGELKPGWKRVKFGQIAECVNDRVDDPSKSGVERYVGLDHLDSECLTIRRWGTPDDVESTKLRFRPGDIIFGKRRAYQRKLAVAEFDGICSAHAMVLRAKPGLVSLDFLPFFMQSDLFMKRAVEISVGSLSPTINWRSLAEQEFALPPMDEQQRIASALNSCRNAIDTLMSAHEKCSTLTNRIIDSLIEGNLSEVPDELTNKLSPSQWQKTNIGSLCDIGNGHGFRPSDWANSGMPIIRIQNVRGSNQFNYYAGIPDQKWIVKPGELLFAWAGVPGVSFGPGIWGGPTGLLNQHIYRVTPHNGIDTVWLYEVLRYLTPRIERRAHGFKSSLLHIKQSEFKNQVVLRPPGKDQKIVVDAINSLRSWPDSLHKRCAHALDIQNKLRQALES